MSVTHGANVDVLDQIAEQLTGNADAVEQIRQHANSTIHTLKGAWQGRDIDKFAGEWATSERQVTEAHDRLQEMAKLLREQAQQQRTTSGVGSGSGAVSLGQGAAAAAAAAAALAGGGFGFGAIHDLIAGGLGAVGVFGKSKGLVTFLRNAGADFDAAAGTLLNGVLKNGFVDWLGGKATGLAGRVEGVAARLGPLFTDAEGAVRSFGEIAGRLGMGATVVSGVISAVTGDGYSGLRGATSRGLGIAGAGGAATLLAIDAGLMSTGVGAPIAVAAVAAYGAWELGNLVYDHRAAIGHFLSNAGQSVANFTGDVASGTVHAVSSAASSLAHGAGNVVSHLIPHVHVF